MEFIQESISQVTSLSTIGQCWFNNKLEARDAKKTFLHIGEMSMDTGKGIKIETIDTMG